MPCVGGCALVMTTAERAKDTKNSPVYLLGGGQQFDRGLWNPAYGYERSLTHLTRQTRGEVRLRDVGIGNKGYGFRRTLRLLYDYGRDFA